MSCLHLVVCATVATVAPRDLIAAKFKQDGTETLQRGRCWAFFDYPFFGEMMPPGDPQLYCWLGDGPIGCQYKPPLYLHSLAASCDPSFDLGL